MLKLIWNITAENMICRDVLIQPWSEVNRATIALVSPANNLRYSAFGIVKSQLIKKLAPLLTLSTIQPSPAV